MLTDEEQDCLKQQLGCMLARILIDAHVAVDAEILLLCAKVEEDNQLLAQGFDRSGWKKTIKVELDMKALEALCALRRVRENKYGRCVQCTEELLFDELLLNPVERFCARCRVQHKELHEN